MNGYEYNISIWVKWGNLVNMGETRRYWYTSMRVTGLDNNSIVDEVFL